MSPLLYDRDADLLLGRFAHKNRPGADVDVVDGGVIDCLRGRSDGHGGDAEAEHHP